MAALYIDHNVSRETSARLRQYGHAVLETRERGAVRAKDDEQLLIAASENWVLITHNRKDFELLHDAWRRWSTAWQVAPAHAGILLLPQEAPWTPEVLATEINRFLLSGIALTTELYRLKASGTWERRS